MKIIFFLLMIALSTHSLALASSESADNFLTVTNISSEYVNLDSDKITILEYNYITPPNIFFSNNFEGYSCTINKVKCFPRMTYPLTLKSLKNNNGPQKYYVEFTKGKLKKRTLVQLLPDDFSIYKIDGQSKLNSNIIFSRTLLDQALNIKPTSELFILKPSGEIAFYRKLAFAVVDFKPHFLEGKIYYSYLRSEASFNEVTILGKRDLLDDKLNFIKTFPETLDMHEFILLGQDWYIASRYSSAHTPLGVNYINQEVIEVKEGKEIYSWSIDELFKQFFFPSGTVSTKFYDGIKTYHQYHLNAVQILPENELLISLGYDGIIIIDKPTKKIKMVLGGENDQFKLTPEQKLVFIHTPYYDIKNQTMTVFHNNLDGKAFKVLEYAIDRDNKKVNKFSIISASKMISLKMGSVEKHGSTYSINVGYSKDIGPSFIEQTDKSISMKMTFKKIKAFIYKIYRGQVI